VKPSPQIRAFRLTLIADTGERFSDFTPYVASVNDAGTVAFQAKLRAGGSGVFTGDGGPVVAVADSSELQKQCGWPGRSNRATAYLTGLLLARKAKAKEGELVLDTGLSSPVKDSIPFVFARGCIDGGLKIIGNIEIDESAYGAERMVKYEAALAKSQKGAKHFKAYEKAGAKVESLPALFKAAKAKLTSG